MQNLWLAFLGAELLLPSSFMCPLVTTGLHALVAAMYTSNNYFVGALILSCIFFLIMLAFQKLFLFLACWWAIILACPQRAMQECTVGFFAIKPIEPIELWAFDTFPKWWYWFHLGFLITGCLLMGCSGETYNPNLILGNWSWTGLFMCKGFCTLTVPWSVDLAMDFKESPDALGLLIAAPARWPKISMVGSFISITLTCLLPAEVKQQWMLAYDDDDWDANIMQVLNSSIFGLSFFGAWLFPWMAAALLAALESSDTDHDDKLFELFLDRLKPIDVNFTPIVTSRLTSLSGDMTLAPHLPSGHIVVEATNLIAARRGRTDTLIDLLKANQAGMTMEQVLGPRGYARVKIAMENEDAIKTKIKDIARARGVRTTVKVVERVFYSPRD